MGRGMLESVPEGSVNDRFDYHPARVFKQCEGRRINVVSHQGWVFFKILYMICLDGAVVNLVMIDWY